MDTRLRNILVTNLSIVAVCLFISLFFGIDIDGVPEARQLIDPTFGYGLMTVSVGFITFFGILDMPGGKDADGAFTSGRVRFCITITLVLLFVVFFGTTAYWSDSQVDKVGEFPKLMVTTLGNLLQIVIPFYFGATAAVEILKNRDDKIAAARGDKPPPTAQPVTTLG
jgi:hypothetical protein